MGAAGGAEETDLDPGAERGGGLDMRTAIIVMDCLLALICLAIWNGTR